MIYNFYELHPIFRGNKVYKGTKKPNLVLTLDTGDVDFFKFMEAHWYADYCWNEHYTKNLELDVPYYGISEDKRNFVMLSVHKGYTFYDVAEHDERVVIAVELGLTKGEAHIL